MNSKKKVLLHTDCTRVFDAHEVIHYRSQYYAQEDKETSYREEYEFLNENNFEITDWLINNMDWYKCKTLKEQPSKPKQLSALNLYDYEVV